ncbi:MAG: hypothetical protein M1284_02545 [Candidatus Parvarchaeota archaeon]|jgi:hypothetical protein|nr:hypothetical protein [Candidatus Parvarchaeota archaeon]
MGQNSLYDLLLEKSKDGKNALNVRNKRRYAVFYTENKAGYIINQKYLDDYKSAKKAVYSIIRSAFGCYKNDRAKNIEILADSCREAERLEKAKKELEESYAFRGTDAGFYEVPILGSALDFSVSNVSIKVVDPSEFIKIIADMAS